MILSVLLDRQIAWVLIIFLINYESELARSFSEKVHTDLMFLVLDMKFQIRQNKTHNTQYKSH